MDRCVKRAVVGVIVFNLCQLYLFRQVWDWTSPIRAPNLQLFKEREEIQTEEMQTRALSLERPPMEAELSTMSSLKLWPANSAYQPWTRNVKLKPSTCEAYFGNGFIEEYVVLESHSKDEKKGSFKTEKNLSLGEQRKGTADISGSFRCMYSETMRTSICEGMNIVMNLDKITVSRGGESIEEVIGRKEEAELPEFLEGAFQVQVATDEHPELRAGSLLFDEVSMAKLIPRGEIHQHTVRSLLLNIQTVDTKSMSCSKRVTEPTLIVTRFEYANLFHTATDWYSAYVSSQVAGLPRRPHVVFLDGHCKSPMDDAWEALFSSVNYAMHLSGPVCFDHAIFVPLGYDTPLFRHIGSTLHCSGRSLDDLESVPVENEEEFTARIREFGEFFASSFEPRKPKESHIQEVNVLFIRREDYLAHPRHNGRPESRLSNELEVYQELIEWAAEKSTKVYHVNIWNGLLAHMNMDQQMEWVKKADVMIGAHGAGLTHLLFAKPSTIVLELSSPFYRRPHFETLSFWMGIDYRVIRMETSAVDVGEVRKQMNNILENIDNRRALVSGRQG